MHGFTILITALIIAFDEKYFPHALITLGLLIPLSFSIEAVCIEAEYVEPPHGLGKTKEDEYPIKRICTAAVVLICIGSLLVIAKWVAWRKRREARAGVKAAVDTYEAAW